LCTPVILVLGRLRQEDNELEDSLSYIVRPCFKEEKIRRKRKEKNLWILGLGPKVPGFNSWG
jgi:hypothetical protein